MVVLRGTCAYAIYCTEIRCTFAPIHVYIVIIERLFLLLTGGGYFAPVQSAFSLAATLCSGPGLYSDPFNSLGSQ